MHTFYHHSTFQIIVPKHHYFIHIALQAAYLNPRLGWNYADEDFMSVLKAMGESCSAGTAPTQIDAVR